MNNERKRPLRVLIFSPSYLPVLGGAELAVKEITDRIDPGVMRFDMATARLSRSCPSRERIGHVDVHRLGVGARVDHFTLPALASAKAAVLHHRAAYDVSWAIMASYGGIAAAFFRMSHPRVPMLLTLQEGDDEEHLKRYTAGNDRLYRALIQPWHRLPMQKADRLTALSAHLVKRARDSGVMAPIDIVPNGADVERFARPTSASERASLRGELGLEEHHAVLITTSRLAKKNAVADLVRALAHLPERTVLLVLGEGRERPALEALCETMGLGHRVKLLGAVPHEELPRYLAIADVFVRPSLSEGMGSSFLEAMAAGVPIVGTPVGGIPDFLRHEETGLFCEVASPPSIAHQVQRLLTDTRLRAHVVSEGRALVDARYRWDSVVERMTSILEALSGTQRAGDR